MSRPSLSRRSFLRASAFAAAGLLGGGCAAHTGAGIRRRPNIVIILADDLGYGDLGCYGNTTTRTPRIDALASEGLRFTDFHSNGALCSPTRASLLTGCYPQRWGIEGVFRPFDHRFAPGLPAEAVTFGEVLRDAGYATALFGKWHLGYPPPFTPVHQGFETFRGYLSGNVDYHSHVDGSGEADWWRNAEKAPDEGYTTDLITKYGVRFIESHRDRPFCLYLAHEAPHFPYQGRLDPPERAVGAANPGEGSRKDKAAAYQEMIEALDEGVGEVLDALAQNGLSENTLVWFCSDNGAKVPGSNTPFSGMKGALLEGGHRVPAIARWPGRIISGVTNETAMSMDLLPTIVEAAGLDRCPSQPIDGGSLLPLLTEGEPTATRTLYWRTGGPRPERAVRQGPWKLHVTDESVSLYQLDDDLPEHRNLADKYRQQVKSMQESLATWEAQFKDVYSLT